MAFLFTPGQLARRAEFYLQLSRYISAGINVTSALDQLVKHPPARSFRESLRRALHYLNDGNSFTESLQAGGQWLPEFDLALLRAGEQSGRLDQCLRMLSDYYTERTRMARQMTSGLMYPVFLFHFAVFILPFPQLFLTWDFRRYLLEVLVALVPVYVIVGFMIYAGQSGRAESWRAFLEIFLRPVPVLGKARQSLALSRLSAALEALLSAGITIIEAWEMAAKASGSPGIRRTVESWKSELREGRTPAEMVNTAPHQFPELFASQYHSGEISGTLEDALRALHRYYQAEGSQNLYLLSVWVPRLAYLTIVFLIGGIILNVGIKYINNIMSAGGL